MSFSLFTSFNGRIGRKEFWIGFLTILILSFPGEVYFDPTILSWEASPPTMPSLPETVWSMFWLFPATALAVKRFNDRDWPWWLGYALSAAWLASFVSPYFGFFVDPEAATAGVVAFWLLFASALFALLDNGVMPGTPGPNRFGPDPKGGPESQIFS